VRAAEAELLHHHVAGRQLALDGRPRVGEGVEPRPRVGHDLAPGFRRHRHPGARGRQLAQPLLVMGVERLHPSFRNVFGVRHGGLLSLAVADDEPTAAPRPPQGPGRPPGGSTILRAMAITAADAAHVARLARLALTEAELARAAEQLSAVLGHMEALRELDLAGVEPTAHALDLVNVTRPDEVRPPWPREEALANAPSVADGAFRVPPAT
jgi:aspartyl-tRNA(Asn)/glutamyl-tRNA(Gln) amidotransferase subunit C